MNCAGECSVYVMSDPTAVSLSECMSEIVEGTNIGCCYVSVAYADDWSGERYHGERINW